MKQELSYLENMHPYMVKRVQSLPQLEQFVLKVSRILSANFPESFWECENLFKELVISDFAHQLINYELSCMVKDGLYTVSDSTPTGFFVVRTDQFRLGLVAFEETDDPGTSALAKLAYDGPFDNKEMLYGLTSHQMIGVRGKGGFDLVRRKQNKPYPVEILDRSRTLEEAEIIRVDSSKITRLIAHEDIVTVKEPSETCVALYFISKELGSVRWEYDPDTLKPTRAIATNMNSSRLQWAAESLAEMECIDSVAALESLYKHPAHFVRWSAISNLIQLDFNKGMSMLEVALEKDQHPHVRNAARKSLDMISE